jgi:prolyl 4-hydroxylase
MHPPSLTKTSIFLSLSLLLSLRTPRFSSPSLLPNRSVFALDGFLTGGEADHLIAFAQSDENPYKLAPSTTGTESWTQGGRASTSSTRTSLNAFDVSSQVSKDLKHRAFDLLRIPTFNDTWSDGIQILKYEVGQAYVGHHDYFPVGSSTALGTHNFDATAGGSNRYATLFLYLNNVEEGGHTVFPRAKNVSRDALGEPPAEARNLFQPGGWENKMITQDCYSKMHVKPAKAKAILFYSQFPDGSLDDYSFHGACPVVKGQKWAANLWVWNECRYSMC